MTRDARRAPAASGEPVRYDRLEAHAMAVLRDAARPSIPLAELHEQLSADRSIWSGDARLLRERLQTRPDLFLLLDPVLPLEEGRGWSAEQRRRYADALGGEALVAGTRVVLVEPHSAAESSTARIEPGVGAALRAAARSLRALATHAGPIPGLRDAVARGIEALEHLHRTATPRR